jgi:hypothetical protein
MERAMNGPERDGFLREMAAAQDELLLRGSAVDSAKVRLRYTLERRARRRVIGPLLVAAVSTAAVVTLFVRKPALTFAVGAVGGELGAPIVAADARPVDLVFSDGSFVALAPTGRARVTSIDNRGAAILVERGRADVSVVPRKNGSWRVDVGPFEVHVKGTRFSIDWDPETERLDFRLQKGAVLITAPCLAGGRSLVAGESLQASCRAPAPKLDVSPEPAPAIAPPAPPAARADTRAVGRPRGAAPASTWRQLAGAQDYRAALDAVVRLGFERELRVTGAADLLILGDVARLAGDPDRALQAYEAARRKHTTGDRSAFAIGLVQFDHRHRYRDAAGWFAAYVAEQPEGPLVEEAQGRLMEAWERAGETSKARAAAESYLLRHPHGQYADLARRLTR